jgi:hypothetical protein
MGNIPLLRFGTLTLPVRPLEKKHEKLRDQAGKQADICMFSIFIYYPSTQTGS